MLEYFNSAIENLGEAIFGEDEKSEDLGGLVYGFDDEDCDVFKKTICEGFEIE